MLIGLLASVCVLLGLSLEPSDTLGLGWIKHVHEKVQTPLSALGKTYYIYSSIGFHERSDPGTLKITKFTLVEVPFRRAT